MTRGNSTFSRSIRVHNSRSHGKHAKHGRTERVGRVGRASQNNPAFSKLASNVTFREHGDLNTCKMPSKDIIAALCASGSSGTSGVVGAIGASFEQVCQVLLAQQLLSHS